MAKAKTEEEKRKLVVQVLTWRDEWKQWTTPMPFDEWKAAVCGASFAHESILREFWESQWDAADCREYMMISKMLGRPPKPKKIPKERVVTLDDAAINKRFAMCLWRECAKLLTRRMTPSARQIVSDMSARMAGQLGIEKSENNS